MNIPDRSKCIQGLNQYFEFTKSIIFESMSSNETEVKCSVYFGPDAIFDSPYYYIYFAGEFIFLIISY